MARRPDPGIVTVRPFVEDDLVALADFCERARERDPGIEPFAQRLQVIATGPRALLELWRVAEGEDGALHGLSFAAVREQRPPPKPKAGEASAPREPTAFAAPPPVPVLPGPPKLRMARTVPLSKPAPIEPAADTDANPHPETDTAADAVAPPQRTTVELYAAVDPSLRRQGLGRALCEAALGWAKQSGDPITLRARVRDGDGAAPGRAFLAALGFAQVSAQLSLTWRAAAPPPAPEVPGVRLRVLRAGDPKGLADLAQLSEAAWAGAPDSFATRADELAQLLEELERLVLVASADGRAAGYLSGVWLGKTLGIEEVAVLPELRRAGLGRALVESALSRGATGAVLSVSEENRAARALYRGLGFQQTARKLIWELGSR